MDRGGSRTAAVQGIIILTLLVSGFVIALRVYARTYVKKGAFGLDDWLIVLTWLLILAYNICILIATHHGYGQHHNTLSAAAYIQVVKFEVFGQFFAILAYPPGKAAVAVCMMRIFPGKRLRWLLWTIVAVNVAMFVTVAIMDLCQCTPARKQWDPTVPGTCLEPHIFEYLNIPTGSIGALTDFVLAIIPWIYILKLHLALRERIAIAAALSLGLVAGIFGVVKAYELSTLSSRTDVAYDTVPLVLWSVGEQCAINIAACIPTLRPLLQKFSPRRQPTPIAPSTQDKSVSSRPSHHRFEALDEDERTLMELSPMGQRQRGGQKQEELMSNVSEVDRAESSKSGASFRS